MGKALVDSHSEETAVDTTRMQRLKERVSAFFKWLDDFLVRVFIQGLPPEHVIAEVCSSEDHCIPPNYRQWNSETTMRLSIHWDHHMPAKTLLGYVRLHEGHWQITQVREEMRAEDLRSWAERIARKSSGRVVAYKVYGHTCLCGEVEGTYADKIYDEKYHPSFPDEAWETLDLGKWWLK